jgi:hypothetical protein
MARFKSGVAPSVSGGVAYKSTIHHETEMAGGVGILKSSEGRGGGRDFVGVQTAASFWCIFFFFVSVTLTVFFFDELHEPKPLF